MIIPHHLSPSSTLLSLQSSVSPVRATQQHSGQLMGNCATTKFISGAGAGAGAGGSGDAVDLIRDRKRLLKAAVNRRHSFADAHARYIHSLKAVAAAIDLFVARHSSPSPTLSLPPPSTPATAVATVAATAVTAVAAVTSGDGDGDTSYLRQTPTVPKTESFLPVTSVSCPSRPSSLSSDDAVEGEVGCGYFFSEAAPPLESPPATPPAVFGWDFFNPFEETTVMLGGMYRGSEEEELRAVREQEGIPDLEEVLGEDISKTVAAAVAATSRNDKAEVVETVAVAVAVAGVEDGEKGLTAMEETAMERELLDALRDIEDQFIRAYDAGEEVSGMLEASKVHLNSGLDELKENSTKLIEAITWHRSPSSLSSSSYKISRASSFKDSSCSESKSDLFDSDGGMTFGSHSQTLGRLYAWEKKLYDEVKTGDQSRQAYEKKCIQLRNQSVKGPDSRSADKTRAAVGELYTKIFVALRSIETISKRIEKVRDEELQPQLIELLHGLAKLWKIMLESHETQKQIILEVKSFTCPSYGKFCSDSQRNVTQRLEAELRNWRTCFMSYMAEQRAYVEALNGWLSRFFTPDTASYYPGTLNPSYRTGAPPLLVMSHNWLTYCKKLPDNSVSYAMKSFIRDIRVLWDKQGEEQQQKRKVDTLAKELDRRVLALQKAETRVVESKLCELKPEPDVRQRVEYVAGRRDEIDAFRKKVEAEKEKHQKCMQETQRATLNGFKTSLAKVFESLTEFSKDSCKLFDDLLMQKEAAKAVDRITENPSDLEGSQVGIEGR